MSGETLRPWIQASRAPFFVATLIPLGLGAVLARADGAWDALRWLAVVVACFLVHFGTNIANDYFDYYTGADAGEAIGGSRVIQEGKITLSQLRNAMILFYSAAFALGMWVVWSTGLWWLVALMVFSFLSSLFYVAPPIRYGYLGLGEVSVAMNMGPVMVAGCAAAVAGHFVPRAVWVSLPVGMLVALILYYQSLPDMEDDRRVGKFTVAVRLGRPAAIWGYRLLFFGALACIVALVCRGLVHPVALVSLVTVWPACQVDRMIRDTPDWKDLHDRGGKVRMLYLANGMIILLAVLVFG